MFYSAKIALTKSQHYSDKLEIEDAKIIEGMIDRAIKKGKSEIEVNDIPVQIRSNLIELGYTIRTNQKNASSGYSGIGNIDRPNSTYQTFTISWSTQK